MADNSKGTALVTGASSGIGAEFARQLAVAGHGVILVARRRDRLERLQAEIVSECGVSAEVIVADLADSGQRLEVEKAASKVPLSMLVNNAGVGGISPFADVPLADIQRAMDVNVVALTRLTHAALPGMLARGHGTIVNVGSALSFATMPNAAVYAGTKAYVVQFTCALNDEVGEKGIRLQALIPGLVRTELGPPEFYDQFPSEAVMLPDALVRASLAGLELNELICAPVLPVIDDLQAAIESLRHVGQHIASARPATPADRYSFASSDG